MGWVLAAVIVACGLPAGCESQDGGDARKTQLLADENQRLEEKLTQCQNRLKEKDKAIEAAKQQNVDSGKRANEAVGWMMNLVTDLREENEALAAENKQLKAEVQQLRAQTGAAEQADESGASE